MQSIANLIGDKGFPTFGAENQMNVKASE